MANASLFQGVVQTNRNKEHTDTRGGGGGALICLYKQSFEFRLFSEINNLSVTCMEIFLWNSIGSLLTWTIFWGSISKVSRLGS